MEKKDMIEQTVRKCVSRLSMDMPEEQIVNLTNRLVSMKDIKMVVDYLALTVDNYFGQEKTKREFMECIEDLYKLGEEVYTSSEEIITQIQENKKQNYTPRKYISRRKSQVNKKFIKNCM